MNPGTFVITIFFNQHRGDYHPEASNDMDEHHWDKEEKGKTLEALLHLNQIILFVIQYFENSEQSSELYQLAQSADPGKSN